MEFLVDLFFFLRCDLAMVRNQERMEGEIKIVKQNYLPGKQTFLALLSAHGVAYLADKNYQWLFN